MEASPSDAIDEEDAANDFEKVLKDNYYDTAVEHSKTVHLVRPIIRKNASPDESQPSNSTRESSNEPICRSDRY